MSHEHTPNFSRSLSDCIGDPLGLRMEASQGEQGEPKTYRGGTVGYPVGTIYQDVALANAHQFNGWCDGLPDRDTREKASRIYSWGFWANQCIFTPPTKEYGEFMLCWLIERGCPSATLDMVKYGFQLTKKGG